MHFIAPMSLTIKQAWIEKNATTCTLTGDF